MFGRLPRRPIRGNFRGRGRGGILQDRRSHSRSRSPSDEGPPRKLPTREEAKKIAANISAIIERRANYVSPSREQRSRSRARSRPRSRSRSRSRSPRSRGRSRSRHGRMQSPPSRDHRSRSRPPPGPPRRRSPSSPPDNRRSRSRMRRSSRSPQYSPRRRSPPSPPGGGGGNKNGGPSGPLPSCVSGGRWVGDKDDSLSPPPEFVAKARMMSRDNKMFKPIGGDDGGPPTDSLNIYSDLEEDDQVGRPPDSDGDRRFSGGNPAPSPAALIPGLDLDSIDDEDAFLYGGIPSAPPNRQSAASNRHSAPPNRQSVPPNRQSAPPVSSRPVPSRGSPVRSREPPSSRMEQRSVAPPMRHERLSPPPPHHRYNTLPQLQQQQHQHPPNNHSNNDVANSDHGRGGGSRPAAVIDYGHQTRKEVLAPQVPPQQTHSQGRGVSPPPQGMGGGHGNNNALDDVRKELQMLKEMLVRKEGELQQERHSHAVLPAAPPPQEEHFEKRRNFSPTGSVDSYGRSRRLSPPARHGYDSPARHYRDSRRSPSPHRRPVSPRGRMPPRHMSPHGRSPSPSRRYSGGYSPRHSPSRSSYGARPISPPSHSNSSWGATYGAQATPTMGGSYPMYGMPPQQQQPQYQQQQPPIPAMHEEPHTPDTGMPGGRNLIEINLRGPIAQVNTVNKNLREVPLVSENNSGQHHQQQESPFRDEIEEYIALTETKDKQRDRLSLLKLEMSKLAKIQNDIMKQKLQNPGKSSQLKSAIQLYEEVKRHAQDANAKVEQATRQIFRIPQRVKLLALDVKAKRDEEQVIQKREKDKEPLSVRHTYEDTGSYWCNLCSVDCGHVSFYLTHLQSAQHASNVNVIDRPWGEHDKAQPAYKPNAEVVMAAVKGTEFVVNMPGFYCKLCSQMMADLQQARLHLFSHEHNDKYAKFLQVNPFFEQRLVLERELAQVNQLQKAVEESNEQLRMKKEEVESGNNAAASRYSSGALKTGSSSATSSSNDGRPASAKNFAKNVKSVEQQQHQQQQKQLLQQQQQAKEQQRKYEDDQLAAQRAAAATMKRERERERKNSTKELEDLQPASAASNSASGIKLTLKSTPQGSGEKKKVPVLIGKAPCLRPSFLNKSRQLPARSQLAYGPAAPGGIKPATVVVPPPLTEEEKERRLLGIDDDDSGCGPIAPVRPPPGAAFRGQFSKSGTPADDVEDYE